MVELAIEPVIELRGAIPPWQAAARKIAEIIPFSLKAVDRSHRTSGFILSRRDQAAAAIRPSAGYSADARRPMRDPYHNIAGFA
jgi:hypothetical protein